MGCYVRVLENEQVDHIFVNFWVLENSAVFCEFSLVYELHLIVRIGLQKLKIIEIRI